jgi:hypothetical protein
MAAQIIKTMLMIKMCVIINVFTGSASLVVRSVPSALAFDRLKIFGFSGAQKNTTFSLGSNRSVHLYFNMNMNDTEA